MLAVPELWFPKQEGILAGVYGIAIFSYIGAPVVSGKITHAEVGALSFSLVKLTAGPAALARTLVWF